MPIRIARTQQPQEPGVTPGTSTVSPVVGFGNPAAAAARTSGQAANLAAQLFQEDRDREVVARVSELDVQRRKADAAVLNSYLQARGKDAVEGRASALAAINENSRSIRSGIQDRAVAEVWNRQDAALTLRAQQDLDAHYRQQNTQWQVDTQEARADQLVNDLGRAALGGGYNPATGQLSVEAERTRSAYHDAIGEMGSILGWSPEQTAVARRKADTAAFSGVARSLIQQNRFEEAARVLERHGDAMDVGTKDDLLAAARSGASRSAIANWSSSVELAMQDQNMPFDARYSEADRLFREGKATAEQRDALLERIDRREKMTSERFASATLDAMTQAESFLARNPMAGLDDLPDEVFRQIERGGKIPEITRFANEGRYTTKPKVLGEVLALTEEELRAVSPKELEKTYRGSLDDSDMKMLRAMQARAVGAAKSDQIQLLTVQDRVREAAAEVLGIPRRGELSEDEAARFYRFRTDVQDRIEVDQKQGKRVDGAALQKILDEAKLNVVSVNVDYWSDLRSSVFGLTKDQQGNAYVMVGSDQVYLSAIPAAEREQIIKDLLATPGAKVTEQRIAELWVLGGRQNAERDRIQAANAAEAQQTVNAAAPPSTADLQKAEEERVRGIRKLFPSPLYEEADRRRQQQKQAAELKQQRQAEEARREAERVREIRRIWGMPPAQSGGGN